MLQSIHLRNFQTHERFDLELDPFVTTLCGKSDIGKSAILRSIRWLAFNKPRGTDFIHWDADHCSVKLVVDDRKIVRKVGKENLYLLDGKKFAAFGTGVPEEIASVLNLSEDSFQTQHQNAFLFSKTPGEVSKELNRIIDLDLIDQTLFNLGSELRKSRTVVTITEERLQTARRERDRLAWVEGAEVKLGGITKLGKEVAEKLETASRIASVLERVAKAGEDSQTLSRAAREAANICSVGESAAKKRGEAKRLGETLYKVILSEKLAKVKIPTKPLQILDSLKEKIQEKRLEASQLKASLDRIRQQAEEVKESENRAREAEEELHQQTEGNCPVCGKPMEEGK